MHNPGQYQLRLNIGISDKQVWVHCDMCRLALYHDTIDEEGRSIISVMPISEIVARLAKLHYHKVN